MPTTATLIYTTPGIYEPRMTERGIEWYRNENGDPFVGLQVNSLQHARKFARVSVVNVSALKEVQEGSGSEKQAA